MPLLPIPFRDHTTYPGHVGQDFPQPQGTPVRASGPGVVTFRGWLNDRAAYSVIVQYQHCRVLYCHYDNLTDVPYVGTDVDEGDVIGRVGKKGANSTGYHLHLEIMTGQGAHTANGVWNYFSKTEVVGTSTGGGGTPVTPPNNTVEDDEMTASYFNVQGKKDSHAAGCFALMRDNSGKLFAKRMSNNLLEPQAEVPLITWDMLPEWQKIMTFQNL